MHVADRNEVVVVRRIAQHTQKTVAEAIGVEPSNFNRFHNGRGHGLQLKKFCELLAFLGIDLSQLAGDDDEPGQPAQDMVTITRAQFEALRTLAEIGMKGMEGA
ncbi:hypothetical protein BKK79_19905 [Cupriavidus sp. USMAA2-4]|uniref:helix-turn-helix domain-containing protein n=1 Tax=Cupriavidus sp. USMAA2-4 TaxID=876364 RepID=UPI0008A6B202|nr:helix-turn-helix domain-containing protein [Cupriavidus sp. USMAA2-4]AOY93812.1 hypothetical protein BKK79_19905 [Cupriavidus sp. USMAA2-4]